MLLLEELAEDGRVLREERPVDTEQSPSRRKNDVPIIEIERGVVHERLLVHVGVGAGASVEVVRVRVGLAFGAFPGVGVLVGDETGICHGETPL